MTSSSKDMKAGSVLQSSGEERRRGPLDQLPPPANSNKPLTPFSIEDILNKPSVKKSVGSLCPPRVLEKVTGSSASRNGISAPSSPLCALEELASKTFKGLEVSVIQAAEGKMFCLFYRERERFIRLHSYCVYELIHEFQMRRFTDTFVSVCKLCVFYN